MGFFGIKTKKDRKHELQMQHEQQEHEKAVQFMETQSREREAAQREEQQTRREQQRLAAQQREANEKRRSAEEIARINAEAEKQAAEIERQTQLDLAEKENQRFAIRAQAEKELKAKQEEERTKQAKINAEKENEQFAIQKEAEKETKIRQAEEQTKQSEIDAEKELELAEKNKQVQIKAIEATQEMFSSYLQVISESKKAEIEFLIHQSETRKAKFLASIEEAGKRKQYLLDLSKDVKGQEKINYLNEAHDIEESIKEMQNADKEADMDLAAKLTMISDSQKRQLEHGQEKLMNVKTLFLNYEGDVQ